MKAYVKTLIAETEFPLTVIRTDILPLVLLKNLLSYLFFFPHVSILLYSEEKGQTYAWETGSATDIKSKEPSIAASGRAGLGNQRSWSTISEASLSYNLLCCLFFLTFTSFPSFSIFFILGQLNFKPLKVIVKGTSCYISEYPFSLVKSQIVPCSEASEF